MYHHLEFKYLNPFFVHSFHAHLSHMHAPSGSYHSLFSPSHPHAHFMLLLSSQTWSLDVSLEKCHTLPIIINYTVFIISHVSTILWYHSIPKLSFSPPHTQSPLVFHFVFLSMGFSHTPYMSLHMTHTTKITLSLSLL